LDLLIELAVAIVVVLICVAVAYALFKFLLKTAAVLFLNAIGGLVILLIANYFFKMLIPYDALTLLVCIAGGVPGAACVIILNLIGISL
jgi:hypothetical protein